MFVHFSRGIPSKKGGAGGSGLHPRSRKNSRNHKIISGKIFSSNVPLPLLASSHYQWERHKIIKRSRNSLNKVLLLGYAKKLKRQQNVTRHINKAAARFNVPLCDVRGSHWIELASSKLVECQTPRWLSSSDEKPRRSFSFSAPPSLHSCAALYSSSSGSGGAGGQRLKHNGNRYLPKSIREDFSSAAAVCTTYLLELYAAPVLIAPRVFAWTFSCWLSSGELSSALDSEQPF